MLVRTCAPVGPLADLGPSLLQVLGVGEGALKQAKCARGELARLETKQAAEVLVDADDPGHHNAAAGLEERPRPRGVELGAVQLRDAARDANLGQVRRLGWSWRREAML